MKPFAARFCAIFAAASRLLRATICTLTPFVARRSKALVGVAGSVVVLCTLEVAVPCTLKDAAFCTREDALELVLVGTLEVFVPDTLEVVGSGFLIVAAVTGFVLLGRVTLEAGRAALEETVFCPLEGLETVVAVAGLVGVMSVRLGIVGLEGVTLWALVEAELCALEGVTPCALEGVVLCTLVAGRLCTLGVGLESPVIGVALASAGGISVPSSLCSMAAGSDVTGFAG